MAGQAPPHPGSYWQECQDVTSGYPYYWNTINNQVVWECPLELVQYRQSLLILPPPLPPPPPGVGGLVPGYASDDESGAEDGEEKPASELERDPEFIGPKMPKQEAEEATGPGTENGEVRRDDTETVEDLMRQIEAEQPPDYPKAGEEEEEEEPPVPGTTVTPPPGTVWIQPAQPPPPPPITSMGLGSLVSSYSDSDTSDQEEEETVKPVKSHLKQVKGNMDSSGRLQFINHSSWQTEEQKAALESYKAATAAAVTSNGGKTAAAGKSKASKEAKSVATGRKQRLALPGGKFNKSDSSENKPSSELKEKYNMQFVKSSTVMPGSQPPDEKVGSDNEDDGAAAAEDLDSRVTRLLAAQDAKKEATPPAGEGEKTPPPSDKPDTSEIGPSIGPSKKDEVDDNDISHLTEDELAEELVEKLQHFKVSTEKISSLKLLAVKIETLYSAWCAGALSRKYLKIFLENAHRRLLVTESSQLSCQPWTAQWDRCEKRYRFTNSETGVTTHINPSSASLIEDDTNPSGSEPDQPPSPPQPVPPPPPPPSSPPPLPPQQEEEEAVPPPPPSTSNNEPEDMDMSDDDRMDDDDEEPPMTPPTPSGLKSSSSGGSTPTHAGVEREETPPSEAESTEETQAESGTNKRDRKEMSSTPPPHESTPGPPGESTPVLPPPAPSSPAQPPGLTATAAPVLSAAPGLTAVARPQVATAPAEKNLNLTDELSSFYSEIGFSDPVDDPAPPPGEVSAAPVQISAAPAQISAEPAREIGSGGDSGPPSPSGSPLPKKRKKNVKVSSSLSMKKKGINSMLAKWQNIK